MAGQGPSANVRDVTTLEKAQWALVAYREEIQQGLIEAQAEVARFTNWLEQQRPQELAAQMPPKRELENAKADLTRAEMINPTWGPVQTPSENGCNGKRKSKTCCQREALKSGAIDCSRSDLCSLRNQSTGLRVDSIFPSLEADLKTAVMPWPYLATGSEVTFE